MARATIHIHVNGADQPEGAVLTAGTARLLLGKPEFYMLLGATDHDFAAYLRRLATEADKLADAIGARLAESTAGETRDVPTPGATG